MSKDLGKYCRRLEDNSIFDSFPKVNSKSQFFSIKNVIFKKITLKNFFVVLLIISYIYEEYLKIDRDTSKNIILKGID